MRKYIYVAPVAVLAAAILFYPAQAGQWVAYGVFAAAAYKIARFFSRKR